MKRQDKTRQDKRIVTQSMIDLVSQVSIPQEKGIVWSQFSARDTREMFFPITPWMMSESFSSDPFSSWRITSVQVQVSPLIFPQRHKKELLSLNFSPNLLSKDFYTR